MKDTKTKLSPASIREIEKYIKECIRKGQYSEAQELAQNIGRKLTSAEVDAIALRHLELDKPQLWHILDIADEAPVSKDILEKVIQQSAAAGDMWIAYRAAQTLRRKLSQNEVDAIYLGISKKYETDAEEFGKSVHEALFYDTMYGFTGKRHKYITMEVNPSVEVGNQLLKSCLEQNLIKTGFDMCWMRRSKDQLDQKLVDQLVSTRYASTKKSPSDTPEEEVFRQASPSVIVKMLKEFIKQSHDSYSLFLYAQCDSTGQAAELAITTLLADLKKIKDSYEKEKALKDLVEKVICYKEKITYQPKTLEKLIRANFLNESWYENFNLAMAFSLPQELSNEIIVDIMNRPAHFRALDLYRKRGGPAEVKEWLIDTFSRQYTFNQNLKFSPEIVAELGGKKVLDNLVTKLLTSDRLSDALETAKLPYMSKDIRDKVIAASIKKHWSLYVIKDLLKLNRRALTQAEIDEIFELQIKELKSQKYNRDSNADKAIETLKLNPSKKLVNSFTKVLKQKKFMTKLVQVAVLTGKQLASI